jgi:hypothetical protein
MPKKKDGSKKHEHVRLPYHFKFEKEFKKPCQEWLEMIETMCNEILGNYTKKEDQLMTTTFGTRPKQRLNRVMDALNFEYPDYERFDKGAEGLKRKRIVSILNRQAARLVGVWSPTAHLGLPLAVLLGRTMLLTVTQWFVQDTRETTGDFLQVWAALRCVTPYFLVWIFMWWVTREVS